MLPANDKEKHLEQVTGLILGILSVKSWTGSSEIDVGSLESFPGGKEDSE